jgi:hypothetical protein
VSDRLENNKRIHLLSSTEVEELYARPEFNTQDNLDVAVRDVETQPGSEAPDDSIVSKALKFSQNDSRRRFGFGACQWGAGDVGQAGVAISAKGQLQVESRPGQ